MAIGDLLGNVDSFIGRLGTKDGRVGSKALAQSLIQQSNQTRNPLVAALTGFVGGSALANISNLEAQKAEEAALREKEIQDKKLCFEESRLGFEAEKLGILKGQAAKQAQKIDAEIEKFNKEGSGAIFDPEKRIKIEGDLRKEYTKSAGDFVKQRDAFGRVQASAKDPSAAGDLALIFNYMKTLDPGSTVREGEFANAENSGSVGTRVAGQYNKVLNGERLTADQRADFLGRAEKLFGQANLQHDQRKNVYSGLAQRAQIDPQNVIIDIGLSPEPKTEQEQPQAIKVYNPITGKIE